MHPSPIASTSALVLAVELGVLYAIWTALWTADHLPFAAPAFIAASSLALRRHGGVRALGLARANLTRRVVGLAAAVAGLIAAGAWWGVRPLAELVTGSALETAQLREVVSEPAGLVLMLVMSWLYAGFGEEWVFRAYPLTRLAGFGPRVQWLALAASSVGFGLAHDYQGPAGQVLSGVVGFVLGVVYLRSGRNLWLTVLAHGFVDTIAMVSFHQQWI